MFRRSASLALPHLKSFAAIPSVSPVQLGHTNRSVFLSHESQREIALVLALSRPSPYYQQGEVGEEKWACVSQRLCFGRFAGRWHRTIRIRIRIAATSRDTMPLRFQSRHWWSWSFPSAGKETVSNCRIVICLQFILPIVRIRIAGNSSLRENFRSVMLVVTMVIWGNFRQFTWAFFRR